MFKSRAILRLLIVVVLAMSRAAGFAAKPPVKTEDSNRALPSSAIAPLGAMWYQPWATTLNRSTGIRRSR